MRHIDCPGTADRHPIFDDQQAREWMCQHQLQLGLQTVAETIDRNAEKLAAYGRFLAATLTLKGEMK